MPLEGDAAREEILRYVAAHPGCHLRELERRLPRSLGALRHHLDRLEEQGLVRAEFDRRFKRYYPPGLPTASRAAIAALRQARLRDVAEAVLHRPGVRPSELARALRIPPSSLTTYVRRLVQLGLLAARADGGLEVPDRGLLEDALRRVRPTLLDRLSDGAVEVLEAPDAPPPNDDGAPEA
jgi:predicted transcriptional regulator